MNIKKSDKAKAPAFFTHLRGERKALAFLLCTLLAGTASALNISNVTLDKIDSLLQDTTNPTIYNLTQTETKGIATWNSQFVLNLGETLNILNGTGSTLIRDVSGKQSQILGMIDAEGSLFLSNKAGVFFGAGSVVDVGAQFLATTADITPEMFKAWNPDQKTTDHFAFTDIAANIQAETGAQIKVGRAAILVANDIQTPTITSAEQIALGAFKSKVTIDMPTGETISFSDWDIPDNSITAGGDITFASVNASGTATLTAPKGNITGTELTATIANIDAAGTVNSDSNRLRTSVDTLKLNAGSAYISEENGIKLTEATTTTGDLKIELMITGDIELLADVTAKKDVSFYVFNGSITGGMNVTSEEGNTYFFGGDTIAVGSVTTSNGVMGLLATNTITTGDLTGISVTADTDNGDLKVGDVKATDMDVNLRAGGSITAGTLEGVSNVAIGDEGTTGKITLNGDVKATSGAVMISTQADIAAQNVEATDAMTLTANGITAGNLTGVGVVANAGAGALKVGDVTTTHGGANLTGTGINAGNLTGASVVANAGAGALNAGDINTTNNTTDLNGAEINVGNITSKGVTADATNGALNAGNINTGTANATLKATTDVTTKDVTGDNVTIVATSGKAEIGTVTASTKAEITAATNLDVNLVEAPTAALTAGDTIKAMTKAKKLALSARDIHVTGKDTGWTEVTLSGTGTNGTINYTDEGRMMLVTDASTADDDLSVKAVNIQMASTVEAKNATLTASNAIYGYQDVVTSEDATLNADFTLAVGSVTAGTNATLLATNGALQSTGTITAGNNVTMKANQAIMVTSTEAQNGQVTMEAKTGFIDTGMVNAKDRIDIDASKEVNLTGALTTDGNGTVTINAGTSIEDTTSNHSAVVTTGNLAMTAGDHIGTANKPIKMDVQSFTATAPKSVFVEDLNSVTESQNGVADLQNGVAEKRNFVTMLQEMSLSQYPLMPTQFTVMEPTGMMYMDRDVTYIPGTEFIRHIRPMASLIWVATEVDDEGNETKIKKAPFASTYNPNGVVNQAAER